jgi:hypothetical protein
MSFEKYMYNYKCNNGGYREDKKMSYKSKELEAINVIDRLLNTCKLEFDEMPETMETEMFEVELAGYGKYIKIIKQALEDKDNRIKELSNQEILRSELDDELKCDIFDIRSKYNGKQLGEILGIQDVQSIIDIVRKSLTPPSADEIIEDILNYFNQSYPNLYSCYLKDKHFVLKRGKGVKSILASSTKYGVSIMRKIPLTLAHKITTFFMNRSDE